MSGWQGVPLRRVPTQEGSSVKVIRALNAADQIVRQDGKNALSLPHVAQRAGVSVGTLYQYLPDRASLVAALTWHHQQRLEKLLSQTVADAQLHQPSVNLMGRLIDAAIRICQDDAPIRALRCPLESAALTTQRLEHRARMVAKGEELLKILRTPPDQAEAVATVAFTAAETVIQEALAAPAVKRVRLLKELDTLLRRYLPSPVV
ncbi:MAG: TetR/AcrR family transcriptional regulator [Bifidobacteriaceae bacterium]|jgi:AcrR family transcriptional regulator|nr:TetR/AcrR family transcriptional regulator [Bifidobacteriaceae bacterium]